MNNIIFLKPQKNNAFSLTILFLFFFLIITIISFNIYKGTKIILPNIEKELRESSNFYLLKSIGWGLLSTLILAFILLYSKPIERLGINKPIKI